MIPTAIASDTKASMRPVLLRLALLRSAHYMLIRHMPYQDLGPSYFENKTRPRTANRLLKRLKDLGIEVLQTRITDPLARAVSLSLDKDNYRNDNKVMFSQRFHRTVIVTRHAAARMAERSISESELLSIIDTGNTRYKDEAHLWAYKHFVERDDNVVCAVLVLETAVVVKTVMHYFVPEALP